MAPTPLPSAQTLRLDPTVQQDFETRQELQAQIRAQQQAAGIIVAQPVSDEVVAAARMTGTTRPQPLLVAQLVEPEVTQRHWTPPSPVPPAPRISVPVSVSSSPVYETVRVPTPIQRNVFRVSTQSGSWAGNLDRQDDDQSVQANDDAPADPDPYTQMLSALLDQQQTETLPGEDRAPGVHVGGYSRDLVYLHYQDKAARRAVKRLRKTHQKLHKWHQRQARDPENCKARRQVTKLTRKRQRLETDAERFTVAKRQAQIQPIQQALQEFDMTRLTAEMIQALSRAHTSHVLLVLQEFDRRRGPESWMRVKQAMFKQQTCQAFYYYRCSRPNRPLAMKGYDYIQGCLESFGILNPVH